MRTKISAEICPITVLVTEHVLCAGIYTYLGIYTYHLFHTETLGTFIPFSDDEFEIK